MGKRGIGALLNELRLENGCTLEQLGCGICTPSQIEKIEQDEQAVDPFLIDRLFGRLGRSTERLEYVLPIEAYELYELRYLIQTNLIRRNFSEAETLLKTYEARKSAKRPLHRQFRAQERAQLGWFTGQRREEILAVVEQAMNETMKETAGKTFAEALAHGWIDSKIQLSAEELKLILFRWEVSQGTAYERKPEEVRAVLSYLNSRNIDIAELVKVLPYAVLLLGMLEHTKEEKKELEAETKKALSILRDDGKIAYLPEILEQYATILEEQGDEAAIKQITCSQSHKTWNEKECFIKMLRQERKSLLEVCEHYGICLEGVRLYEHIIRRFQLDYEIIRRTRQERGISQEKLSDGICELPTLSRIERGHRSPRDKNLYQILERLQKDRRRIDTIIETDSYEVIRLKRQYNHMLLYANIPEAEATLRELETYLDPNHVRNQQFLRAEWAKVHYAKQEWDAKKCLEELKSALQMTMDVDSVQAKKHVISVEEDSILNEMVLIYNEHHEVEKAKKILQIELRSFEESRVYPVFRSMEWGLVQGNLATLYEENGITKEAIELSQEKNRILLEAGKGNTAGRSLITIAGALEQQQDESCVSYFQWGMDLLRLYKIDWRYEIMLEYVNRPEFLYRDQLIVTVISTTTG